MGQTEKGEILMRLLCIDPGPERSGVVEMNNMHVISAHAESENHCVLDKISAGGFGQLLVEMIACYGMPVGRETFETCVWIGRFVQQSGVVSPKYIYRRDVKLHLCNSAKAKDANIRQAILDRYAATGGGKTPQVGTKKDPGPLYGVKSHSWSALALGIYWIERANYGQKLR